MGSTALRLCLDGVGDHDAIHHRHDDARGTELMDLVQQLRRDEALRLTVYDDGDGKPIVPGKLVKGHPTVGIGRALDVNGISSDEANYLLANDISKAKIELAQALPWTTKLDDARKGVLLNMSFNLGVPGLLKFKQTLALVQSGDYNGAADAMLNSAWAQQVGARATRLSQQMRTGQWV